MFMPTNQMEGVLNMQKTKRKNKLKPLNVSKNVKRLGIAQETSWAYTTTTDADMGIATAHPRIPILHTLNVGKP